MKSFFQEESGGAMVEVAILSLVMVPMAIYAIFFMDMSLINIKTLEASRYAAWEMTVMQISDYKNYGHKNNSNFLANKIANVSNESSMSLAQEVQDRWGDDMNSATSQNQTLAKGAANGIFQERVSGLSVTELEVPEQMVTIQDGDPYAGKTIEDDGQNPGQPESDGGAGGTFLQNFLSKASGFLGKGAKGFYDYFSFYTNGFAETKVSMGLKFTKSAPIYDGGKLLEVVPTVSSAQKLLIDSWDVKYGGNVDIGPQNPSSSAAGIEYYNQVKKMVFGGLVGQIGDFIKKDGSGDGSDFFDKAYKFIQGFIRLPWDPVVRSYALKHVGGKKSGCPDNSQKNIKGCFSLGKERIKYEGIDALSSFYTNVYKDTYAEGEGVSPYHDVYKRQSPDGQNASMSVTGYYMGCDKPQTVDRQDCWKN